MFKVQCDEATTRRESVSAPDVETHWWMAQHLHRSLALRDEQIGSLRDRPEVDTASMLAPLGPVSYLQTAISDRGLLTSRPPVSWVLARFAQSNETRIA